MAKIFITGITGFIGSNIARVLASSGHTVIAVYRAQSSRHLCEGFADKITWVLQDEDGNWVNDVIGLSPSVVIHAAWLGVGHLDRDNWKTQLLNIDYLQQLLYIAKKAKAAKFIGLGSQAEYGVYNGCIDEHQPLNATEAYGCVKIICTEMVKQYCTYHAIDWYWLRLFSFFGKGESENWLIPSIVKKMSYAKEMDFTGGEQKYSYLYVNDLGVAINKIITKAGKSGIYNISGKNLISLRTLIEKIRDKINPEFVLNFGKLPYRANQSMHIQGNCSKFENEFGIFDVADFDQSLTETIEHLVATQK